MLPHDPSLPRDCPCCIFAGRGQTDGDRVLRPEALHSTVGRALVRSEGVLPLLQVLVLDCGVVQCHRKHRRQVCALTSRLGRLSALSCAGALLLSRLLSVLAAASALARLVARECCQTLAQEDQGLQTHTQNNSQYQPKR
jgi:hypothetical protein